MRHMKSSLKRQMTVKMKRILLKHWDEPTRKSQPRKAIHLNRDWKKLICSLSTDVGGGSGGGISKLSVGPQTEAEYMAARLIVSDGVSAPGGDLRHRAAHQLEHLLGVDFVVGGVVTQLTELAVAEREDSSLAGQDDGVIFAARHSFGLLMS